MRPKRPRFCDSDWRFAPKFLPEFFLDLRYELVDVVRHIEFGMRRREKDEMCPDFRALWRLRLHGPVRAKEDEHVERDERKGDDGPASAFHVFMAQRDEHGKALSVEIEPKRWTF